MKQNLLVLPAIILFSFLYGSTSYSQDSLLQRLAADNLKLFNYQNNEFKGEGWDYIMDKIDRSKNVLVGEDHFSNEIPAFIKSISQDVEFDNFYIEMDPYSTKIIEDSFKEFSNDDRIKFNKQYSELFSFYALRPEYELLEAIQKSGARILGSDQVVMYADRLIFQDIVRRTENQKAKDIYTVIIEQSRLHLEKFYENPANPMYFMTAEFSKHLQDLQLLDLSETEDLIIADMQRSVVIYKEQNHRKRVQLILHQLMKDYPKWNQAKNLFKYGANHMARGESFLTVFDIGNVVANITESNYEQSFHIMIIGESGMLGSPFKTFPPNPVDTENAFYLSYLKPFFKITQGSEWHMFNMIPLRKAVEKNRLKIENSNLLRVIKGFDVLVVIPEVTAAKF